MQPTDLASILPTAEEFHEFARGQMAWITDCLADGDHDCWTPQLMVMVFDPGAGKSLELMTLDVPFSSDGDKRLAMMSVGAGLHSRRKIPLMACLSTEAWMSRGLPKGMRPADDPCRKETVILFGMTVNHLHCMANAPLLRPAGKIVPTEFDELKTEGVQTPILEHFFHGFLWTFMNSTGQTFQHSSN